MTVYETVNCSTPGKFGQHVSVLTHEQINALIAKLKNLHVKFGTRGTPAQRSKLTVVQLPRTTKFSLGNQILMNGCPFGKTFLKANIIEIFPIFELLKKVKWMKVLGIAEVCSFFFEKLTKLFALYPLFFFTIQAGLMLLSLQYMYDSSIQNNDHLAFQADKFMKRGLGKQTLSGTSIEHYGIYTRSANCSVDNFRCRKISSVRIFLRHNRTCCEKCNIGPSDWESNPRPRKSSETHFS